MLIRKDVAHARAGRIKGTLKDARRKVAVLEGFTQAGSVYDTAKLIEAPPHCERFEDGTLSPPFGTVTRFERDHADYKLGRSGVDAGGLWDEETYMRSLPPEARARAEARAKSDTVQRYDAEKMQRFVHRYPNKVSLREQEVYVLFYLQGLSKGATAQELSRRYDRPISRDSVENALGNLRRKMRAQHNPRGKLAQGSAAPMAEGSEPKGEP